MEYAKDEVFKVNYNNYAEVIEYPPVKENKRRTFFQKNKIMISLLSIGLAFCLIDAIFMIRFFSLLQQL